MKRKSLFFTALLAGSSLATMAQTQLRNGDPKLSEQWTPEPRIVTPGKTSTDAPADAIILFNGKDASAFRAKDGGPVKWKK